MKVYVDSFAHSFLFEAEKNFDPDAAIAVVKRNWHLSIYWCTAYFILMLSLRRYMRNRPPFQLQTLLVLWNLSQAFINILGTYRGVPEIFAGIMTFSFTKLFCTGYIVSKVGGFWLWVYGWLKLWDLCDTLFIVLRKRPLTYLHMIHHALTFILTWYFVAEEFALGALLATLNATIHSFMYTYYTVKSLGFRLPEYISIGMTILQMVQLFAYFILPYFVLRIMLSGIQCRATYVCCFLCSGMNGLYLILFINFFYKTYIRKKKSYTGNAHNGKTN